MKNTLNKNNTKKEIDTQRILKFLHMMNAKKQITKILDDSSTHQKKSV